MIIDIVESKTVSERLTIRADFQARLDVGEFIVTFSSSITAFSGEDSSPSDMIPDSPTLSGTVVKQIVEGGLPGVIYNLFLAARTNRNNVLVNIAKVSVLTDSAITPEDL